MIKTSIYFLFFSFSIVLLSCSHNVQENEEDKRYPNDYFFRQRAYPNGQIDQAAYKTALSYKQLQPQLESRSNNGSWELAGPTNIGGRIADLAISPSNENTIYVGAASGGIFKTQDGGENWIPIFDGAASLSIGDITLAPSNEQTIYVGTGEPNAGGGSLAYDGLGVYKSKNAGESWENIGLENVGSIGKVSVHPTDENTVFVAAMGHLFGNNSERGVYRTQNGGETWEQVLFVSDSTGAIDLAIHPQNSDIIYAAMWERIRRVNYRQYHGATSGIYRSMDGGDTWEELTNGLPNAPDEKGRIGIDISLSNPDVLYASYVEDIGALEGIYKTTNGGNSWTNQKAVGITSVPFMWWFGNLFVDPANENTVYYLGFNAHKSVDGGRSWQRTFSGVHVDQHALCFAAQNTDFVLLGNDGGLYKSTNAGRNNIKINNLPITQFYTCEIDASEPERLYGGTQDNSTMRTLTGALNDWSIISGGDGFRTLVDPNNNRYVYTESQYGRFIRSTNGGDNFTLAISGISNQDRKNWNTPVIFDPSDASTLYLGTNRLYKSTNRAVSWTAVSPDLTDGGDDGNLVYGTITAIDVSPVENEVIYVGTDDGNVWVSKDGGSTWAAIKTNIPKRWITNVLADPNIAGRAYLTVSGFRYNSDLAHVFFTEDYGETWIDISSNLPDVPVNDIVKNSITEDLYIATDIGVFISVDDGISWDFLGTDLPNVPIIDLDIEAEENLLVAATYGRSLYKYDLQNATNTVSYEKPDFQLQLFPNPVQSSSQLTFELSQQERVTIEIYDATGKKVSTVINGQLEAGKHQFPLHSDFSAGQYWLVLRTDNAQKTISFAKL
ncbi:MAG: T9SS type A sorting domain-containing protein [Bacteroidota bacterium]